MTHASFIEWCKTADRGDVPAVVDAYFEFPGVEMLGAPLILDASFYAIAKWAANSTPKPKHQDAHTALVEFLVRVGVLVKRPRLDGIEWPKTTDPGLDAL
jgi:hypothetical protein